MELGKGKLMKCIFLFLSISVLMLRGCAQAPQISNEYLIKEMRKCSDAGTKTELLRNGYGQIRVVQCVPPEGSK